MRSEDLIEIAETLLNVLDFLGCVVEDRRYS
jgi:hypothetical protein